MLLTPGYSISLAAGRAGLAAAAYSPFARLGFLKVTKHTPAIATAEQAKANQGMAHGMAGAPDFAAKAQLRGPASRLARPARTEIGNVFILVIM